MFNVVIMQKPINLQLLPKMIENKQLEELVQILGDLAIQIPQSDELNQFIAQWVACQESQSKKVQHDYIRKLVRGQLNQSGFQYTPEDQKQKQEQLGKVTTWRMIWDQHENSKNVFVRISKNEAVIRVDEAVYFINPSKRSSTFAVQLDISKYQLYFILTNSNLKNVSTLLWMLQRTKCERIITTEQICNKIVVFESFLKKNKVYKQDSVLKLNIGLLREQEYFQYGRILWKVKSCCWFQPVYDLQISIKDRKPLLIEGPKIYESKSIYYGWKKNYISEDNYQKYTAQTQLLQKEIEYLVVFELGEEDVVVKKGKKFLNFIKKELIRELQNQEKQDIWRCCEELQFGKGQVIIKKGTLCDYIYALQSGQFELIKDNTIHIQANKDLLYGLQQIKRGDKKYSFDLKSKTHSTVQRIRVENVKFHLYDYLVQHK